MMKIWGFKGEDRDKWKLELQQPPTGQLRDQQALERGSKVVVSYHWGGVGFSTENKVTNVP